MYLSRTRALLLVCVALRAGAAEALLFRAAPTIPISSATQRTAVVTADFNGDKRPDVAVANADTSTVSVFLSQDDGQLAPLPDVDAGAFPIALFADDFDGDTVIDLLTAEDETGRDQPGHLWFLRGLGNGTFATPQQISVGHDPSAFAAGDLNEDGNEDLAVTFFPEGIGFLRVLFGNGHGTFGDTLTFPLSDIGVAVAIADLDHDHHLDIVSSYSQTSIAVRRGHGDGTFDPPQEIPVSSDATAIAVADVDGDTNLDIVIAQAGVDRVLLLRGKGGGAFAPAETFGTGQGPAGIALADFDGDQNLDAAVFNLFSRDVSLLLGAGTNAPHTFRPARTFVSGGNPKALGVLLDAEAVPRLVVANLTDGTANLGILSARTDGTFNAVENVATEGTPTAVAVADMNDDARPDLVVGRNDAKLAVLLGQSAGGFAAPRESAALGFVVARLARGDFNGDGIPDIVATSGTSRDFAILLGRGDGGFASTSKMSLPNGSALSGVVAADLNRDGVLDLTFTQQSGTVATLLGSGDGSFGSASTTTTGGSATAPVAADFNGDGWLDIAAINSQLAGVTVLLGKGDGTFLPAIQTSVSGQLVAGTASDLNGDGIDDLAVSDQFTSGVRVLIAKGDGSFTSGPRFSTGQLPFSIGARDLDGDGHPDIVTANQGGQNTSTVTVFINDATGHFSTGDNVAVGYRPQAIAAADFDGDGRYDLATVNAGVKTASLVTNDGAPPVPRADGNGDGRRSAADLVATVSELGAHDRLRAEDLSRALPWGWGVDANGDGAVTPQDLRAATRALFGDTAIDH